MSYKELFVHLDSTERSDHRREIAFDLARRFNASVAGLYGECDPFLANLASQKVHEMFADLVARAEVRVQEKGGGGGSFGALGFVDFTQRQRPDQGRRIRGASLRSRHSRSARPQ